jgi:hypothetical protein
MKIRKRFIGRAIGRPGIWLIAAAASVVLVGSASAEDRLIGKISVCRIAREGADRGTVYLPGDGTYSGNCDASGENCRKILVGVMNSSLLQAGQACATLDAVLLQSDGAPLTAGTSLIARWDTGNFESIVKVVKTFQ